MMGILQEDGLHFRMSRYSDMEDRLEVAYAMKLLTDAGLINPDDGDAEHCFPYILSLSRNPDSLLMWQLYANKADGIAFEIDRKFENIPVHNKKAFSSYLHEVNYSADLQVVIELAGKYKGYLKYNGDSYPELLAAFFKHPQYSYEEETRLIFPSPALFKMKYDKETAEGILRDNLERIEPGQFRYNGTRIVRYSEIIIPREYLRGIIIGHNSPDNSVEVVKSYLEALGYPDNVDVRFSDFRETINHYSQNY